MKYQKNVSILEDMEAMVDNMITLIGYGNYDVYSICEKSLSKSIKEIDVSKFNIKYGDFTEQWSNACLTVAKQSNREILFDIGNILGNYDSETQIRKLTYLLDKIRRECKSSKDILVQKKKICLTVGCFFGLLITTLVI